MRVIIISGAGWYAGKIGSQYEVCRMPIFPGLYVLEEDKDKFAPGSEIRFIAEEDFKELKF